MLNDAGQTAFFSFLTGTGVTGTNNGGIFSESGGTLGLVALVGDAAPGTGAGVNFIGFGSVALNDAGQTAFVGTLTGTGVNSTNDVGLFATDLDGNLRLIAREGDLFDINPDPLIVENHTINFINVAFRSGSSGQATGFNNAGQLVFAPEFIFGANGIFVANTQAVLAGDLNGDGFVGVDDLNIILINWNQNVTPGDLLSGDPDGSGFVGVDDLNIVLLNWNNGAPPADGAAIPEPGTVGWLGIGGLLALRRRG